MHPIRVVEVTMFPVKTEKAREELQRGSRHLSQRERAVLLMADGSRSIKDFHPLFTSGSEAQQALSELLAQGYLQAAAGSVPGTPAASKDKLNASSVPSSSPDPSAAPSPAPSLPQAPSNPQPTPEKASDDDAPRADGPLAVSTAADSFGGKRSLATTRMFLFDICERMFVRRDPQFANQIRDALREARSRESMMTIAALMLTQVERSAGPERAQQLRERIDLMLPIEALH